MGKTAWSEVEVPMSSMNQLINPWMILKFVYLTIWNILRTLFQWGFSQGVEEGGFTWDSITDTSKMESQWIYRRILIGASYIWICQPRKMGSSTVKNLCWCTSWLVLNTVPAKATIRRGATPLNTVLQAHVFAIIFFWAVNTSSLMAKKNNLYSTLAKPVN